VAVTRSVGFAVDGPPISAALHGVVNRLTLQDDVVRWEGGVGFESLACAAVVEVWGLCDSVPSVVVDGSGNDRGVFAPSFGVTATDLCSSTLSGSDFRERAAGRVEELLLASSQKAVESELKWGHVASAASPAGRWLASPETVVVDSSGVSPEVAVALLEDAYAGCSYGGGGVLHLSPGSAIGLWSVVEVDGVLFTPMGTQLVLGSGYVGPVGSPAPWDGNWMFITGPVLVWLGDVQVFPEELGQAVAVATNDIRYKAERLAAVTFDGCCVFAVKVDVTKI